MDVRVGLWRKHVIHASEKLYWYYPIFDMLSVFSQLNCYISDVSSILLYLTYKRVFYQVWLFIIAETISIKVAILLTRYLEKLFCKPKPTQPVNTATAIHFLHLLNLKKKNKTRTIFFCAVPTEIYFPGK